MKTNKIFFDLVRLANFVLPKLPKLYVSLPSQDLALRIPSDFVQKIWGLRMP